MISGTPSPKLITCLLREWLEGVVPYAGVRSLVPSLEEYTDRDRSVLFLGQG